MTHFLVATLHQCVFRDVWDSRRSRETKGSSHTSCTIDTKIKYISCIVNEQIILSKTVADMYSLIPEHHPILVRITCKRRATSHIKYKLVSNLQCVKCQVELCTQETTGSGLSSYWSLKIR
jgi:hypothetical protein